LIIIGGDIDLSAGSIFALDAGISALIYNAVYGSQKNAALAISVALIFAMGIIPRYAADAAGTAGDEDAFFHGCLIFCVLVCCRVKCDFTLLMRQCTPRQGFLVFRLHTETHTPRTL